MTADNQPSTADPQTAVDQLVAGLTPTEAQAMLNKLLPALAQKAAQAPLPQTSPQHQAPLEARVVPAGSPVPPLPPAQRYEAIPMSSERKQQLADARRKAYERDAEHASAVAGISKPEKSYTKDERIMKSKDAEVPVKPGPAVDIADLPKYPHQIIPPVPTAAERPIAKPKTMAEATGIPARKDELQLDAINKLVAKGQAPNQVFAVPAHTSNPTDNSAQTKLSESTVLCPSVLAEPNSMISRGFDTIKRFVSQACADPNLPNGADIFRRFVFNEVDTPAIPVTDAILVSFSPMYVLGRHLDGSATRYFPGYAQPNNESIAQACAYLLDVIKMWANNEDFKMGEAPGNAKQSLAPVKDGPSAQRLEQYTHRPRVYVCRPFDYPNQVCVVIA